MAPNERPGSWVSPPRLCHLSPHPLAPHYVVRRGDLVPCPITTVVRMTRDNNVGSALNELGGATLTALAAANASLGAVAGGGSS